MLFPWLRLRLIQAAFGLLGLSAWAQEASSPWSMTAYLQQSWPKQTETNRQIREINTAFGASFRTWDDVPNLNLGLHVFRELNPRWKLGLGLDYSRGKVDGAATVATHAGPATLSFKQEYSIYADLFLLAQYRPMGSNRRWVPFLLGGFGLAYERDQTRLVLRNSLLDESLRVDNSGWFPIATLGVGVDAYLTSRRTWYAEAGLSYSWARLRHSVPAAGSLAPSPAVTADTDSTGPNVWLGVGRRF
ncbi:MAG: hypothetical protein LWW79_03195 [Holophagaceae bacterium]|nr:hypothetical protein [Holophagaceae bacterium]